MSTFIRKKSQKFQKRVLQFLLLALSIVLIIMGVMRGEARTVLQKAIIICLECIGIG